jgi:hypothetical protein
MWRKKLNFPGIQWIYNQLYVTSNANNMESHFFFKKNILFSETIYKVSIYKLK